MEARSRVLIDQVSAASSRIQDYLLIDLASGRHYADQVYWHLLDLVSKALATHSCQLMELAGAGGEDREASEIFSHSLPYPSRMNGN